MERNRCHARAPRDEESLRDERFEGDAPGWGFLFVVTANVVVAGGIGDGAVRAVLVHPSVIGHHRSGFQHDPGQRELLLTLNSVVHCYGCRVPQNISLLNAIMNDTTFVVFRIAVKTKSQF